MAFEHSFDSASRVALITGDANAKFEDCVEAVQQASATNRLPEGYGVMVDLRKSRFAPPWDDAEPLAAAVARASAALQHRIAFVASGPTHVAFANLVASLSGLRGAVVKTFREPEEARHWLRREPRPGSVR